MYYSLFKNKKRIITCIAVIMILLFSYIISSKIIYDEWFVTDWGSVEGEKRIESIDCLEGHGMYISDNTINIDSENKDPYFFIEANDVRYLQIFVSELSTVQTEYFKIYFDNNGAYTEKNTEIARIKEGNNVFCFDESRNGKLRIDIEGNLPVSIRINYIKLDNDVQLVSEFVVLYIFIVLATIFIVIMAVGRTRITSVLVLYKTEIVFVTMLFAWFLMWSLILPYNTGPDECMRYDVAKYIYNYRSLPRGDDPILCAWNGWGVSYAYSPYLAYLLSSFMMYIASVFGETGMIILHVARLVSVLSSTVTIVFLLKISKELEFNNKYTLPILVGLFPEFTYISAYVNNDAFAIMSVSIIIYAWCIGLKSRWNIKSCVFLTVGMSICVAAYYNCYGYLLISFICFVLSNIHWSFKDRDINTIKKMLIKGIAISVGTFAVSGWWFIRNYILYDGDILGTKASREAAIKYAVAELSPLNKLSLKEQGVSLCEMLIEMEWIKSSAKSFVGCFGYMQYWLNNKIYYIVGIIMLLGIVMKVAKYARGKNNHVVLDFMLIVSSMIVIMLSIIYSYTSDYQPQGRYALPMLIPLMIFVCDGYNYLCNISAKKWTVLLEIGVVVLNIYAIGFVIIPAYYW